MQTVFTASNQQKINVLLFSNSNDFMDQSSEVNTYLDVFVWTKQHFGGHSKEVEIFDCMPPVFGALIYCGVVGFACFKVIYK